MTFIERKSTPWLRAEYLAAMSDALLTLTGMRPPRATLAILWAQSVLECGRHGAVEGPSCWDFNVGNLRGAAPDGSFTVLPGAWEIDAHGSTVYPADQRFRAYTSLRAGALDMLTMLSRQANFARAWTVLTSPNPTAHAYVEALHDGRYFTADPRDYERSVESLSIECMRNTPVTDWPATGAQLPPPPFQPDGTAGHELELAAQRAADTEPAGPPGAPETA